MTTTELATVAPAGELSDLIESAIRYTKSSRSENTRRAYGSVLKGFESWCASHGLQALPPKTSAVAGYLTARADQGAKASTLRLTVAALSAVKGSQLDVTDPDFAALWHGISRTIGTRPTRKAPVLANDLRTMLATLDRDTTAGPN